MSETRFQGYGAGGPPGPTYPGRAWPDYMASAMDMARAGAAFGEVPVGALLIDADGEILARAANRVERDHDPTAHAEILALRQGAAILGNCRLGGCVLVTTLEPCLMCAGALSHARLAGLVFGAADVIAGAIVSRADYYDLPGSSRAMWHLGGVLSEQCARLLEDFFAERR